MGPFYTGKFCDRARETDMASAQAKRARGSKLHASTNENKSEQTKQWTKQRRDGATTLLARELKNSKQKQGILCCRRSRCCCSVAVAGRFSNSINQSFIFSFTSFSHFLFDATDASCSLQTQHGREPTAIETGKQHTAHTKNAWEFVFALCRIN